MSAGFGFSVGDFIAAIELVVNIIDALRSSGSASAAFQDLVSELSTLHITLVKVSEIQLDPSQTSDRLALEEAAAQCQHTIHAFWTKIEKYQPYLQQNGPQSSVKDAWMKIRWALCKKEDLAEFKAALQGHRGAIELLLVTLQMNRTSLEARQQDAQQKSMASRVQYLSFQVMGQFATVKNSIASSIQQGEKLLDLTGHVLRTNLEVFNTVLSLQNYILSIPSQVMRQQPVYFWDARGFYAPFQLEFINSSEVSSHSFSLFQNQLEVLL